MTGLVLKLSPKERILINGAVIENGDRRSRLCVMTPNAKILRMRYAIHPKDANTPVRRACYATQLVLSGDAEPNETRRKLMQHIEDLSSVLTDPDSRGLLSEASDALVLNQFYRSLKALRALLPMEARLLAAGQS